MSTSDPTPTSNPALSAEEIGGRFLKLLEGLNSRDDLSLERIKEVMGISLTLEPGELSTGFWSQDLGNGWRYAFTYVAASPSLLKGVELSFQDRGDGFSDMTPVCALDFDHYHDALKAMGFVDSPIHGEIGQLESWRYTKFAKGDIGGDITISIIPQNQVARSGGRLCVKSIGTLN